MFNGLVAGTVAKITVFIWLMLMVFPMPSLSQDGGMVEQTTHFALPDTYFVMLPDSSVVVDVSRGDGGKVNDLRFISVWLMAPNDTWRYNSTHAVPDTGGVTVPVTLEFQYIPGFHYVAGLLVADSGLVGWSNVGSTIIVFSDVPDKPYGASDINSMGISWSDIWGMASGRLSSDTWLSFPITKQ